MKKIILWVLVLFGGLLLLAACREPAVGISEVDKIPDEVQTAINPDYRLQLMTFDNDPYYVIFQSTGKVTAEIDSSEDTLNILLNVSDQTDKNMKQHVYELFLDPEHEVIDVQINGESVYFDESVILN